MATTLNKVIGRIPDDVSKGDKELNKDPGRVRFGVRIERLYKITCKAVECGLIHDRPRILLWRFRYHLIRCGGAMKTEFALLAFLFNLRHIAFDFIHFGVCHVG